MKIKTIKYITVLIPGLMFGFQNSAQKKWQKEPIKAEAPVCFASNESGHSFILPPKEFISRLKSAQKTSDIILKYVNFPDSLKPALEYAVEIWESIISSPVPIYMEARWQVLGSTTLGTCGPSNYYINFESAPLADTYYPVALVEKITEEEETGSSSPDLIAKFNSAILWYIGTDGKTPSSKYDFVSTVLHEIAHGLGFTGFFYVRTSSATGYYGNNDSYPSVYDRLVEDINGKKLTNNNYYKNSSNDLFWALVSNQLYSGSPVAYSWFFHKKPRLYAPTSYKDGSSIYHLNDTSYPYGSENALMTPASGKGEAIHSPGPLTSGIIADLGWKHLYIRYQPIKDAEEMLNPLKFKVSVNSDLGLKNKSLYLIYSKDNFKTQGDSILFGQQDSLGYYTASLLSFPGNGKINYYISARDTIGRIFSSPAQAPKSFYNLNIGPDSINPVITHTPASYVLSSVREFEIKATVTDNIGIDTVMVSFFNKANEQILYGLVRGENDIFSGKFKLSALGLKNGDSITYSFTAVDKAKRKNTSHLPIKGKFSIGVEGIYEPVTDYATDFNSANNDFILSDFKINRESGFDNAALNSPHPYPSPDKDNTVFNFTTILRYPIVIAAAGRMVFDEIVLVEPGETGAVFGGPEFWDYVIVEGSNDFGKTWLPFIDGYDSGSQISWKTVYNKSFAGNNSTSVGSKELYVNRDINLTGNGNFKTGDTVIVRFRLYSDPYSHGWGWAIDNLKIQQNTTAVALSKISPGNIFIWPNPAENGLNMIIEHEHIIKHFDVVIYDITGKALHEESFYNILPGTVTRFDLTHVQKGLFFVAVKIDGMPVQVRKIVKK